MEEKAPLLIYLVVFGIVFIPYAFLSFFMGKSAIRKENIRARNLPPVFRVLWGPLSYFSESMDRIARLIAPEKIKAIENDLLIADIRMSANQVIGASCLLAIGCSTLTDLILLCFTTNGILLLIGGIIAMLIGAFYPFTTIRDLALKRQQMIMRSLPFAIDLIASAMRGGLDFSAAVRFYVKLGIDSPLTDEYSQMLREMELGVVRTVALQNMADRIHIREFTSFAAAIALGTELGAPLTETMEIQGEEMRKARFALAECKAQRAPSLMLLPMALFILPAVFIIILTPVFLKMREAGVPLF